MSVDTELLSVVGDAAEGGYVACGVGQDIFTEAKTLDELPANEREGVECHLDSGQQPSVFAL